MLVIGVAATALLTAEIAEHGQPHAVYTVPAAIGNQANIAMGTTTAQVFSVSPIVGTETIPFIGLKG